jgi:hypothetical protein
MAARSLRRKSVSDPDAPPLDPDALIGALKRHKVAFVAVGGLAAQWHGAQRTTKNMDICPAWDNENLERLAGALRELGARLKTSDRSDGGVSVPIDGTLLRRMEIGTWRTDAGDIDVLLGIPREDQFNLARYEQLHENAVVLEIGESTIFVASLKDIIRSKEVADRQPDREALPELRSLSHGPPERDDDLYQELDR